MRIVFYPLILLSLCGRAQVIYDCNLWGMASQGGTGNGTVFSYNIDSDTLIKRSDFSYVSTGSTPYGSLFLAPNGNLLGLATYGGTGYANSSGGFCNGCGTLVEYNTVTDSLSKRIDFDYAIGGSGSLPTGALMQAGDGSVYGMTGAGANSQLGGAIFKYDLQMHTAQQIVSFTSGLSPAGSLIQASNSKLYGMTLGGGSSNYGVLFSYDPVNDTLINLENFDGSNSGSQPTGDLMQAANSLLYGMTSGGGSHHNGTLFSFDIGTNIFTKIIDFNYAVNGSLPSGSLIQANNGKLYGLTSRGGSNNLGTLFEFDATLNSITKKIDFAYAIGQYPMGTLMQASNGKLYGVTSQGGAHGGGVIFEYDIASGLLNKKADYITATGTRPQRIKLLEVCKVVGIEPLIVTVPNVFTPNGDGINDDWNILINFKDQLKNPSLIIYNRWGTKVFSTSELSVSWNGRFPNGTICNDGTYYYILSYFDLNAQSHISKGFISLTR